MKRPANPAEAQQRLLTFVRQLHRVRNDGRTGISAELAEWVILAVSEHLISESDLGQALGLERKGAGRPSTERERKLDLALRIHPLIPPHPKRANWKKIAQAVNYTGKPNDLRKLYEAHFDETEFLARGLDRAVLEAMAEWKEERAVDRMAELKKARARIAQKGLRR